MDLKEKALSQNTVENREFRIGLDQKQLKPRNLDAAPPLVINELKSFPRPSLTGKLLGTGSISINHYSFRSKSRFFLPSLPILSQIVPPFPRSESRFLPMDTFFISHGSPTLSIDERMPARHFLMSWKSKFLSTDPKAILMVSAHWDKPELAVNSINGPNNTIHDFYGFPKPMYEIKYSAPGAPELANRVKELLKKAGFGKVEEDKKRGLDHGAWVPLMFMYPEANIPVCQLSVQSDKDGTYHYNVGKALSSLREEGVLIVGSGSATHNLRLLGPDHVPPPSWAVNFDKWLTESLLNGRHEDVKHYEEKGPAAKTAHPEPEHYYPLLVALGAAGEDAKAELIHHSWSNSSLSYSSYKFQAA